MAKQVPAINDSKRGGRTDARLRTSKNVDSIDGSNHGESNAPTPQLPTDAINSINQIASPEIVDVDEIREQIGSSGGIIVNPSSKESVREHHHHHASLN